MQTIHVRRGGSLRVGFATVALAAALASFMVVAPTASAERAENDNTSARHCVIETHGIDEKGDLITAPEDFKCYPTFADSLRAVGVSGVRDDATPQTAGEYNLQASGVIGVHYDGHNATGASMTVTGTVCGGGGLNVPSSFNDRISSTYNGCPTIIHWEHGGYGGSTYTTFGVGNLTNITGYMDNRTSSIRYYS